MYIFKLKENIMKYLLSFSFGIIFSVISGQEVISYPYNPDANNDSQIAISDLLETISIFGSSFAPNEIVVNGETLSMVITQLQSNIFTLQEENMSQATTIASLQSEINTISGLIVSLTDQYSICCSGLDVDADGILDIYDNCIDLNACNYDSNPTQDCLYFDAISVCGGTCLSDINNDGICDPVIIDGCLDSNACNFNPSANNDNNSCVYCDDFNPCTNDTCVNGVCVYSPSYNACDDGDACTYNDVCFGGLCQGTPVNCDDGNANTYDSCDPQLGCQHIPIGSTTE
ncbi:MAG: hypothetical protein COA49_10080 [Bacteroidetes bacterium]|nr:MAG: hypothetical protein COA49_10080 [Bacteroidota bacterium]